jgi:2-keto-4-pentenoate hydratase/2-oxohepta-3-ene-1,7-dioic acid hydratase in catechol pathway
MKLGTVNGRAVIVDGPRYLDAELASRQEFPADMPGVLERWTAFCDWAARAAEHPGWLPLDPATLGAPVPHPRQVFALAVNYPQHAAEAAAAVPEYPYVFAKFPTCITGPYDEIVLPSDRADWEVELVVVIGRTARGVTEERAWDHVAGLTIGQDISERRVQFRKPLPNLTMAKSFPTFGPTGPYLVTPEEFADRDALPLRCLVDDETMQDGNTSDLAFPVARLIADISATVPLLPGDLIFTGTPSGVGSTRTPRRYLRDGEVITSQIAGIGQMVNRCRAAGGEEH